MTKFAIAAFQSNKTGAKVEGEYIIQSSTHYQVAADGRVVLLDRHEWEPAVPNTNPTNFADLFAGFGK